jgi:hypothetical protein
MYQNNNITVQDTNVKLAPEGRMVLAVRELEGDDVINKGRKWVG